MARGGPCSRPEIPRRHACRRLGTVANTHTLARVDVLAVDGRKALKLTRMMVGPCTANADTAPGRTVNAVQTSAAPRDAV